MESTAVVENKQNGTVAAVAEANHAVTPTEIVSPVPEPEPVSVVDDKPTKRKIRVETWKKMRETRTAYSAYIGLFNRIPNFVDAEKAANLLAETDEFKNAKSIKVNIDKSQDPIKLRAIADSKDLYLPAAKDSTHLFIKINNPPSAEERKSFRLQKLIECGTPIGLAEAANIKLDILVLGSVAVSRTGQRIGKGNGYVDLDYAILLHSGAITKDTVIVTTVHDNQVFDSFPNELFEKYDVPVDIIVTPTEVIRIAKRLPRPTEIIWHILSERRLGIVPILKVIKEDEEKKGKIIVLKSEDTDVESNRKPQRRRFQQRRFFNNNQRRFQRRPRRNTDNKERNGEKNTIQDQQGQGQGQQQNQNQNRRPFRQRRNFYPGRGFPKNGNDQQRSGGSTRRLRPNSEYCIKVTNIPNTTRVKDLKVELRKRKCNPLSLSWKGVLGKCFLYYGKRPIGEDGTPDDLESIINQTLTALEDLSLDVPNGEAVENVKLNVELMPKPSNTNQDRIETEDVSAV